MQSWSLSMSALSTTLAYRVSQVTLRTLRAPRLSCLLHRLVASGDEWLKHIMNWAGTGGLAPMPLPLVHMAGSNRAFSAQPACGAVPRARRHRQIVVIGRLTSTSAYN